MDLRTPGGQAWRHLVDYAKGDIATRPAVKTPLGKHTLEDLLIAHLLMHQRHNYTGALMSALASENTTRQPKML